MSHTLSLVGAVEAGGTKFVCAIGHGPGHILARERFPTDASGQPQITMDACIGWFREQQQRLGVRINGLGIGSFGPVDLATASIGVTPKPGWAGFPVGKIFADALQVPVAFDTDVNAAALGEHRWGAGQGLGTIVYLTIGTGIGGGLVIGGKIHHGAVHPEMGHFRISRSSQDNFPGKCPFHGACWEGLCAGPALAARWGQPVETLAADHQAWAVAADEIAEGLNAVLCLISPHRIILGGSVPKGGRLGGAALFAMIRQALKKVDGNYLAQVTKGDLDQLIVPAALGDDAGVLGCFALAHDALNG